jgi:ATP-binding cassette subfamily C (CFTR/MRP) protein 1
VLTFATVNLLPYSDRIIALSAEGTIVEQGTFQELSATDGYVSQFCLGHVNETSEVKEDIRRTDRPRTASESKLKPEAISSTNDKRRQRGDLEVYKYYFKYIGRRMTAVFFILACGWAFFGTFPSRFTATAQLYLTDLIQLFG